MASKVYTLHLFPPLAHGSQAPTGHYTGKAREGRLRERWIEHALGRGARLLQVHISRGGKWVVAQVEPGGTERERQLKQRGASRRCEVCKAQRDLDAGKITKEEALARSGWENASEFDRGTLLEIFGIEPEAAPVAVPHAEPAPFVPAPSPEPVTEVTPEMDALVDELIAGWSPKAPETSAAPEGELCAAPETEMEMEMEAG